MDEFNASQLALLAESVEIECKAAQGRDGRGELPAAFWESYSAMANTQGGEIFLGVEEKPKGIFVARGLADFERVRKAIWDNLHNRKQISVNLLQESDIQPVSVEGAIVLRVRIPRAMRHQRPVHIGENPFLGNTYVRRHEGDYKADEETVRRMLAERVEDARDARVLEGYDIGDLDLETVAAYRNRFSAVKPGHVWLDLDLPDFLERIGAFGRDRERNINGLRLAGLLMFGRAETIRDALPNYMVDYQERPEAKAEKRWIDRLIPDGTWSGNIYDFFRKVYQKLTNELKVPFQLQDGQRIEDTPVHEALREALVNTLIHADFSGRVSVLVVKRPDMFGFRNPGLMRIPIEMALLGGNSDCRNRRLQTMFQLVGYGDHAGSGIPKIYRNWQIEHWRKPLLYEVATPEQTLMELRMVSLFPEEVVSHLHERFGERFRRLPELERLALVTAATERTVNHGRLREICSEHSADISKSLATLVREKFLDSDGTGRGTVYFLHGTSLPRPDDIFGQATPLQGDASITLENTNYREVFPEAQTPGGSGGSSESSGGLEGSSGGLGENSGGLPEVLQERIRTHFPNERIPGKLPREQMRELILALCEGHFVPLRALAQAVPRSEDVLRKDYLNPLVAERLLERQYPTRPNHPSQAYRTCRSGDEK